MGGYSLVRESGALRDSLGISVALSSLAVSSRYAKPKIMHDGHFNPYACAIGFGCGYDCCVIAGDSSENHVVSSLLLRLASAINRAMNKNESLMGIDINRVLAKKGVWILPDVNECESRSNLFNLISDRLSPKKLMEISQGNGTVRYTFGRKETPSSRLLAFLISASSGYGIEKTGTLCENSLCNWFVASEKRPAFRIAVDSEKTTEELYIQLLEAFVLFITA